jgi:Fe2+ or Zn2+ uptake regulation protein
MVVIAMRMTRQRQHILEALAATRSHPSAEDLLVQVRTSLPRVSLGSIYRNLRVLREAGLVREIVTSEGRRYDAVTAPHPHFVCERCSRVYDLPQPLAAEVLCRALPEGFAVSQIHLELRGTCSECGSLKS